MYFKDSKVPYLSFIDDKYLGLSAVNYKRKLINKRGKAIKYIKKYLQSSVIKVKGYNKTSLKLYNKKTIEIPIL